MRYEHQKAKALRETDPLDNANVADRFKGMRTACIRSIRLMESSPLIVCCSNEIHDFNLGSVIRSANGFGARKIVMVGRRQYNRRGTVGSHHYIEVEYIADYKEAFDKYRELGYRIVAAEYDPNREQFALVDYIWDQKTFLVVGEEGRGLESDILDAVDDIVYIPMMGSIRSFNVASAASVMIYDYNVNTGYY